MFRTTLGRTLVVGAIALGMAAAAVAGLGARPADASCPLCPQPGGPVAGGTIVVGGPTMRAQKPDLVVQGIGIETFEDGELHVGATIESEGGGTAKGPITVSITGDGVLDRTMTIDALTPGATHTVAFAYNNPLNPGTTPATGVYSFCVIAMLPPTTVSVETDLAENSQCTTVTVGKP